MDEEDINIVDSSSSNIISISPPEEDINSAIDKLNRILNSSRQAFIGEKDRISDRIHLLLWTAVPIALFLVISYALIFCNCSWLLPDFNTKIILKTWYEISLRLVFISLLISIIVFCLKLLKSYLSLSEQISHKITVINSISAILYANEKDDDLFKIAYIKIVEVLVQGNNMGLFPKEEESKMQSNLIDLLKVFKGLHH